MSNNDRGRSKCVLCGVEISRKNSSKEHLILKTFGGRRTTRRALCRACNTRTGRDWDSVLEQQLRRFIILVELTDETNKKRKEIIRESQDKGIVFKTGMLGGTEQMVEVEYEGEPHLVAEDKKDIENEIRKRQEEGRISEEDADKIIDGIREKVEVKTFVEFEDLQAFGGYEVVNSVIKSMLTTACTTGLEPNDLLTGKATIEGRPVQTMTLRGQVPIATFLPVGKSAVVQQEDTPWIHCVHIETDDRARYVWGYVELFGTFRFAGIIGRKYMGKKRSMTYCIDIAAGEEVNVDVDMNQAKELFRQQRCGEKSVPELWQQNAPNPQPLVDWGLERQGLNGIIRIEQDEYSTTRPEGNTRIHRADTRIVGEPYTPGTKN